MEQIARPRTEHPAPRIINLIGPTVIIALAATLFMSDFTFKNTLGAHFGVRSSLVDPSLQTSMAEGFFTLIGGTKIFLKSLMTWLNLTKFIAIFVLTIGIGIFLYRKYGGLRSLLIIGKIQRANFHALGACVILLVIGLGAISGDLVARSMFQSVDAAISLGCHYCSVFRTSTGEYVGAVIFADKQRIVLAQAHGVRLIKIDDVVTIVRPK